MPVPTVPIDVNQSAKFCAASAIVQKVFDRVTEGARLCRSGMGLNGKRSLRLPSTGCSYAEKGRTSEVPASFELRNISFTCAQNERGHRHRAHLKCFLVCGPLNTFLPFSSLGPIRVRVRLLPPSLSPHGSHNNRISSPETTSNFQLVVWIDGFEFEFDDLRT